MIWLSSYSMGLVQNRPPILKQSDRQQVARKAFVPCPSPPLPSRCPCQSTTSIHSILSSLPKPLSPHSLLTHHQTLTSLFVNPISSHPMPPLPPTSSSQTQLSATGTHLLPQQSPVRPPPSGAPHTPRTLPKNALAHRRLRPPHLHRLYCANHPNCPGEPKAIDRVRRSEM